MKNLKMTPAYRFGSMTPWGGSAMRDVFHKDIPDDVTGESLEVSVLPGLESRTDDGRTLTELEADHRSTSEVVQDFLAGSSVVKTLNHIGYKDLESLARPAGAPDRRALALAGDDEAARAAVGTFLDRLGYDPVDAGPLAAGRAFEPDTPIFAATHPAARLTELLSEACALATR